MSRIRLSGIDLRILSVFVDVVDHEGFSPAASATGTSLSTITRDVAALETRLGLVLCRRGRSGFALTQHGQEVYAATRQLMEDLRSFEARLTTVRETFPDALGIGLIDNMATVANPDCHVIEALGELRRHHEGLDLRVGVYPVTAIDVLVRERRIDVGFTANPDFLTPLTYTPAFDERHGLYVSTACPQYEEILSWNGAAEMQIPYVVRTFSTKHFRKFEETMPFKVTAIGNSLEAVLAPVRAGFGAGIVPLHVAGQFPELRRLPFPEGGLRVPFFIVLRKDAQDQPAVAAFLKAYRKHKAITRAIAQV